MRDCVVKVSLAMYRSKRPGRSQGKDKRDQSQVTDATPNRPLPQGEEVVKYWASYALLAILRSAMKEATGKVPARISANIRGTLHRDRAA